MRYKDVRKGIRVRMWVSFDSRGYGKYMVGTVMAPRTPIWVDSKKIGAQVLWDDFDTHDWRDTIPFNHQVLTPLDGELERLVMKDRI